MKRSKMKRLLPLAFLALVAGAACDDDDDDGTQPGALEITLEPTSLTMSPGDSADVTVTLTRTGTVTGDVTLEVSDLPAGVSAEAVDVLETEDEGTLTFVADSTAEATQDTVTVTASGASVEDVEAELELIIEAGGAAGAFLIEPKADFLQTAAGPSDSGTRLVVALNGSPSAPADGVRRAGPVRPF